MKSMHELGEDEVVRRLLAQLPPAPHDLRVGPGDDCAVVPFSRTQWQLLKTDAIIEGVHFLRGENFRRVGWKAIARVVSDFAAMGGMARWFLVTMSIPPSYTIDELEALYQGMADCAAAHQASIVGGETTGVSSPAPLGISIAATGVVKKSQLVLRSTAQRGDVIFITGKLGGSLAGRHLDFLPRVRESQWLTQHRFATAMMDLSDGLAKDLPRLAMASSVGFQIDLSALPCHDGCSPHQALNDGEDYELLFTVSPSRARSLQRKWPLAFPDIPLSRIGHIVEKDQSMQLRGGWDHFPHP